MQVAFGPAIIDAYIKDINQWQALCGRHQVMKKNYWDTNTGKMNVYAIIQSSTTTEKEIVFKFLLDYFWYVQDEQGNIHKIKKVNKK
jgi:chloramphenicol O-acetyltransferase